MRKLKELFSVPVPAFERPTFRTGGGGSDNSDTGDKNPGGAGGGVAYGSDDLVLDPMTGELVKYGDIIKIYCEKMYERLDSDLYTEEQKKVIRKYFELLLGGLEKEEGN